MCFGVHSASFGSDSQLEKLVRHFKFPLNRCSISTYEEPDIVELLSINRLVRIWRFGCGVQWVQYSTLRRCYPFFLSQVMASIACHLLSRADLKLIANLRSQGWEGIAKFDQDQRTVWTKAFSPTSWCDSPLSGPFQILCPGDAGMFTCQPSWGLVILEGE